MQKKAHIKKPAVRLVLGGGMVKVSPLKQSIFRWVHNLENLLFVLVQSFCLLELAVFALGTE
ncbi:MAG: hypothetical protein NTW85_16325 [Methylococcales bacterium]|nr:hypothetical protein [Methylococcales bacterium]